MRAYVTVPAAEEPETGKFLDEQPSVGYLETTHS